MEEVRCQQADGLLFRDNDILKKLIGTFYNIIHALRHSTFTLAEAYSSLLCIRNIMKIIFRGAFHNIPNKFIWKKGVSV